LGLAAACLMARRNLRSLSADRPGAWRLFAVVVAVSFGAQVAGQSHVGHSGEIALLLMALSWAAFVGGAVCVLYLAIEPAVRRSHPFMLVSWSRLMAGRLRDPLLASHLLAACSLGVLIAVTGQSGYVWAGFSFPSVLDGTGPLLTIIGRSTLLFICIGLAWILLWVLSARLLRREWAVMLLVGLTYMPLAGPLPAPWPALLCFALNAALFVYGVRFFGLTGGVVLAAPLAAVVCAPVTSRLDAWHTQQSLWVYVLIAAFAAWQLRIVLRGRPLGAGSEVH
jgi:hypothetical protein